MGDSTSWKVVIEAVEGFVRTMARSRVDLLPQRSQRNKLIPVEEPLLDSGQASAPTVPVSPIISYSQMGHEPFGGGKGTGQWKIPWYRGIIRAFQPTRLREEDEEEKDEKQ